MSSPWIPERDVQKARIRQVLSSPPSLEHVQKSFPEILIEWLGAEHKQLCGWTSRTDPNMRVETTSAAAGENSRQWASAFIFSLLALSSRAVQDGGH